MRALSAELGAAASTVDPEVLFNVNTPRISADGRGRSAEGEVVGADPRRNLTVSVLLVGRSDTSE